jgi:signal transduction histidine kinase
MRLGTKISLWLTVALVLTLSIYALNTLGQRRYSLIQQMRDETLSVGTALALPLEGALRDREYERLQPLLNASEQIGEIYGLYLADAGGAVRLQTQGAESLVDPQLVREALLHDRNEDEFVSLGQHPVYVLYLPLHLSDSEVAGVLVVARSLSNLSTELDQLQSSILATVLFLLAVLLLGSMFLIHQSVTHPVNILVHAVQEIGGGNFRYRTPIPRGAGREIVMLGAAIEAMGRRLEDEHQRLEEETAKRVALEARLRHADKLATLGQVAAGLAHEIGTPLNIIGGRAEMAIRRMGDNPEKAAEHLHTIRAQVDRINETVQRLLNVARRQEPKRQHLTLVSIVTEVIALLDPTAAKAGVTLHFQALTRGEVYGDGELLQQVFTNLILNAIQASPSRARIEINLQPVTAAPAGLDLLSRPYFELSVTDQGPGVPPELRGRIFEPFYTTKPAGSGTGLGLAICAGIVKEHEGFIRVGEPEGGGARFSVFLPADVKAIYEAKPEPAVERQVPV